MESIKFDNITEKKIRFIDHGIQYYIVGRISKFRFVGACSLISAILFHHAIENFLKSALSDHYSLQILKKKRHDLPSLLKLHAGHFPESKVMENKKFINRFHKIYKTRYVQLDGSHRIGFISYTPTKDKRNICEFRGKKIKYDLEWSLEEIDEVIYNICNDINIGPTSIYDYIAWFAKDSPEFYENNAFFNKPKNCFFLAETI